MRTLKEISNKPPTTGLKGPTTRRLKMTIVIKTRKEVSSNGKLGYRVTEIKALQKTELPGLYLTESPHCFLSVGNYTHGRLYGSFEGNWDTEILMKTFYEATEFENILIGITKCGEKLKNDRKVLALLKAQWSGKKTFTI